MSDLLFLPETERSLMNWLLREKAVTLTTVASHLEQEAEDAEITLNALINQGFVKSLDEDGERVYQPCLTSRKGRQVPKDIWNAIE